MVELCDLSSLHVEVQQKQDAASCEDLEGRISTRSFESLLKSEVLGTKKKKMMKRWVRFVRL